jgi:hypothetical protein
VLGLGSAAGFRSGSIAHDLALLSKSETSTSSKRTHVGPDLEDYLKRESATPHPQRFI